MTQERDKQLRERVVVTSFSIAVQISFPEPVMGSRRRTMFPIPCRPADQYVSKMTGNCPREQTAWCSHSHPSVHRGIGFSFEPAPRSGQSCRCRMQPHNPIQPNTSGLPRLSCPSAVEYRFHKAAYGRRFKLDYLPSLRLCHQHLITTPIRLSLST